MDRVPKRVMAELKRDFSSEENCAIHAKVIESDLTKLRGMITGPPDSPFEGGKFELQIDIPENYPFKPPKVKFTKKIWHPNIRSVTGAVCLDILNHRQWNPAMSLRIVLLSIQALLQAPEPDYFMDIVVANQYKDFPEVYKQTASHWSQVYAGAPKNTKIDTSEFDGKLRQLKRMGFTESQSRTALSIHSCDVECAIVYILKNKPESFSKKAITTDEELLKHEINFEVDNEYLDSLTDTIDQHKERELKLEREKADLKKEILKLKEKELKLEKEKADLQRENLKLKKNSSDKTHETLGEESQPTESTSKEKTREVQEDQGSVKKKQDEKQEAEELN